MSRSPAKTPLAPRRRDAAWVLLDLFALQLSIALVFGLLARSGSFWRGSLLGRETSTPVEMPGMVVGLLVGLLVVLPLARRLSSGTRARDMGLCRPAQRSDWSALPALCSIALLLASAATLLAPGPVMAVFAQLHVDKAGDLLVFITLVAPLFAALSEEMIYRGVMQTALSTIDEGYGTLCALLAFLTIHLYQGWVGVVFYVLPLALAFTATRRRIESLWPLVLAHLIIDVLLFAGLYALRARPELRVVVCLAVLAGSALIAYRTRALLRILIAETSTWLGALRESSARRHLPWALIVVIASAGVQMAVVRTPSSVHAALILPLLVAYTLRWRARRAAFGSREDAPASTAA